jgi:hypothetical protein
VIKSRRKRWMRLVAGMGKQKILSTVLVRKPEVRRAVGRPSVYEMIILK